MPLIVTDELTSVLTIYLIKIVYIESLILLNPYHMNKYQNGADG